jgi:Spy/CpxP family protein refolding chaperone
MGTGKTTRRWMTAVVLLLAPGSADVALAQDNRPQRPDRPPRGERGDRGERQGPKGYSIEQATSDQAQLHTVAFSGLAFVTGDFGASTFLPPGKVCDFFGFQYMRDIDAARKGHNPMFLGRVAGNVLKTLNDDQRATLAGLAREQAPQFDRLARMRWPVIKAFHRALAGDTPAEKPELDRDAVVAAVADLFALDGEMSYRRAEVFGKLARSLTPGQQQTLAGLKFGDFAAWPEVDAGPYRMQRGTEKVVNVAYMTYASEFFSWYAGGVDADTYFCPERHGTYFGGFYMKDMPAMGKKDYDIPTSLTGDSGRSFLELLTPAQRASLLAIPDQQRAELKEVVDTRRAISTELRKFLAGEAVDRDRVLKLCRRYGELDGSMSYRYAAAFVSAGRSMSPEQKAAAMKLRNLEGYTSAPAYVYSAAAPGDVQVGDTDHFFRAAGKPTNGAAR